MKKYENESVFPRKRNPTNVKLTLNDEIILLHLVFLYPFLSLSDYGKILHLHTGKSLSVSTIFKFYKKNQITFKKACEVNTKKFRIENIIKLYLYIDVIHSVNNYRLKFFDETCIVSRHNTVSFRGRSKKGVRLFKRIENAEQYRLSINGLTCINGVCPAISINLCEVIYFIL